MTSLNNYTSSGGRPTAAFTTSTSPSTTEPLGGTADIERAMDRFPLEVYQRGRDSRLYRFVATLCGDAGAGAIKKQSYIARLRAEGEHVTFKNADDAYTSTFGLRRLPSERYDQSVSEDALVDADWQDIAAKDNAFVQRAQDFFTAVRWGGSPLGIEYAARAGAGVDCEVIESYRAIFDAKSDDVLGLVADHPSAEHFRIEPQVTSRLGALDTSVGYAASIGRSLDVTVGAPSTATTTWSTTQNQYYLKPELERNLISLVDRLRPVGSSMTVTTQARNLLPHVAYASDASSTRFIPVRFVTGLDSVTWPAINPAKGHFITSGVEVEAPRLPGAAWERPIVFFTVIGIKSYTDLGLFDPTFGTAAFWDDTSSSAPVENYRSAHTGLFDPVLASVYPAVKDVSTQQILEERLALAQPFSPLTVTSRGAV